MSLEESPVQVDQTGMKVGRLFTKGVKAFDTVKWVRRDAVIVGADGKEKFRQDNVEVPDWWSDTTINVVAEKYFRVVNGTKETSAKQMFGRVALWLKEHGLKFGVFKTEEDATAFEQELLYMFVHGMHAFNSPVWFNMGVVDKPQCSACFIQDVDDDMKSIMDLATREVLLFKGGSGTGGNLSKLRSSYERLAGGGLASGPVSFMRGFDAFAGVTKSGGTTRRAAKMVVLNVDHPDILQQRNGEAGFITCKSHAEKIAHDLYSTGQYTAEWNKPGNVYDLVGFQNANNSVRATDDFMKAVEQDLDWNTREVKTGKPVHTYKATKLWEEMAKAAWVCGDPGVQFHTTTNDWHTCKTSGAIHASNPCQPAWATVYTKDGIKTFADIDVGSVIWSGKQWTKVVRKIATGTKPVFKYYTKSGFFVGTEEHKVISNGERVEVRHAKAIDPAPLPTGHRDIISDNTILECVALGSEPVWDIEVEAEEHTYWTGGLLVSNCSEYLFLNDTACNLSSLNLLRFADGRSFNTEGFIHAASLATIAKEIIVGGSSYPSELITENSHKYRTLGLGYTNLGALLTFWGLPYDSNDGRAIAGVLTAIMGGAAQKTSAELARVLGPFSEFERNRSQMLDVIGMHWDAAKRLPTAITKEWSALIRVAYELWRDAHELGTKYGYRNAQVTVLAPTGTISFLMGADTTGIEPMLGVVVYKKVVGEGLLVLPNGVVEPALKSLGYTPDKISQILEHIRKTGSLHTAPDFDRARHGAIFAEALGEFALKRNAHIDMMAAVQPFISGGISKTVNMPKDCTWQDIAGIYMRAWKAGLKCVAVYRDGCKLSQPIATELTEKGKAVLKKDLAWGQRKKLPETRSSKTHKFDLAGHEGYITVGMYDDGEPAEIFIRMAKQGSTLNGLLEAWAIAVSIGLQYGVPLETFVDKYQDMKFEPSGFTSNEDIRMAKSIPDYIFRWVNHLLGKDKPEEEISRAIERAKAATLEAITAVGNLDGPPCTRCGHMTRRSGSCYCCTSCGTTTGCS